VKFQEALGMRGRPAGLLLAAALIVGACGSSANTSTASEAATPAIGTPIPSPSLTPVNPADSAYAPVVAAKTGGSLVVGSYQRPTVANPYYAQQDYDFEFTSSLFEGLAKVSSDLRYVPVLAASVPTVENGGVVLNGNGMDVTWQLRDGMQWSDGQPITCDDVRMTWSWVVDSKNASVTAGTAGWSDITGVDGGGGLTCVVHFSTVYEGYLGLFSAVLPGHYLQTVPVNEARAQLYAMDNLADGVYSGPYIPKGDVSATGISLIPNPDWATISGHAPWLASVKWRYYPDAAAMIKGYQAGEIGLAVGLTETDIPTLAPALGSQAVVRDSLTYELQAFNNTSFKTKFGADAPVIIQAIKHATDRQANASGPHGGTVSVIVDFVSPLSWFYRSQTTATAADPTSAATILANAGWVKNDAGYLTKGRTLLELNYCTTTRQARVDTLALVAKQLRPLGIKVDVNARPNSDVFSTWTGSTAATVCSLARGNFDVAEFSYVSPIDPLGGFNAYVSTQTPAETPNHDGQNITGVDLQVLDQAYGAVRATADLNAVRDAMFEIQELYQSDKNTYELPLYFRKDVWLVSPSFQNLAGGPTMAGAAWNMGDWWLS
jgi:peptide/nickel transport system substrate-binding protein